MNERKTLAKLAEIFNTNIENLPDTIRKMKKDLEEIQA